MDTIGVDIRKRESQLCIVAADGAATEPRIARCSREHFTAALGGRPPARVLVEASTESEWTGFPAEQGSRPGGAARGLSAGDAS